MKKLLLILFIFINLSAQDTTTLKNPIIYAALGDNIYNNIDAIENLQKLDEFQVYKDQIKTYVAEVKSVKKMGYAIEEGNKSILKKDYLNKLRTLSKTNDFFVHNVKNNFKYAIKNNDNKLFVNSVDSGLLNIKRYKKDIQRYYYNHEDEIDEYGDVLRKLISSNESVKVKRKVYKGKSKKQLQEEKMRRIRQKDKQKQEAMQKALENELIKKKNHIRKVQKKELESTAK